MIDKGTRTNFGEGSAIRELASGKGRPDLISPFALRRLGVWCEQGATKYGDRNWEKGMPFSRYVQSLMRHMVKFLCNDKDEDHLSAIMWNVMAIIHHQELKELQWDDLPKYNETNKNSQE